MLRDVHTVVLPLVLLFGLAFTPVAANASQPAPDSWSARFLASAPSIDGVLDPGLASLPAKPLTDASGSPGGLEPPRVRVAYGTDFLYVFVELDADRLVTRDRAYQNGDGLLVVLTRPRPDGAPAEEFVVLGFSAGQPAARWQQRFVWYRNMALEMRQLDDARIATASASGRSAFEVLVPWSEVYPFHPWLGGALGINACVTQALPGEKSLRSCLVPDNRVDSEQSPRRSVVLPFDPPSPDADVHAAAVLERNHLVRGETTRLRIAVLSPAAGSVPLVVRCFSGEGTRLLQRQVDLPVSAGLSVGEADVGADGLPPGGYMISWEAGSSGGRTGLSVLAAGDSPGMERRLEAAGSRLAPGSVTTLRFQIGEVEQLRRSLKPTDTAAALRAVVDEVVASLAAAEAGVDRVAARTGIQRRAYRSAVDGTLQPYSIRVPAGYSPGKQYPLLVWLHGSGQDDRDQLTRAWLPPGCILLAPRGRGPSTWYAIDHAQDDIREAVEDVTRHYSVDRSRVVLAGFSMGGYGVYRTQAEDRSRYRALAVFSGSPRARGVSTESAPDFLAATDLTDLARVPLFVFHGGRDRNCPVEETRALVDRLKAAGADVTLVVEDAKGHESAGPSTLAQFAAWFERVLAGPGPHSARSALNGSSRDARRAGR